ncbi:MAG: V-type ATP synthase subunit F [Desulfatiglandales bacterium]
MEQIYIIGDMHTVSAFRLSGVIGVVSGGQDAAAKLEDIIRKGDAAVVAVTNDLADDLSERIREINISRPYPVVIAIPGIDDPHGFRRSVVSYIAEALGISL